MSWLDILSLGIDVTNYAQIQKTREQIKNIEASRMNEKLNQEYLEVLKNLVFASSRSVRVLSERLEFDPQRVYVGAKLLAWRLNDVGVTPEFFSAFADKEYVADTQENIKNTLVSAHTRLSPEQIENAEHCCRAILEMPMLNEAIRLKKGSQIGNQQKQTLLTTNKEWENMQGKKIQNVLIGLAILLFGTLLTGYFGSAASRVGDLELVAPVFTVLLICGFIFVGLSYIFKPPSKEYEEIAQQRQRAKQEVDTHKPSSFIAARYQNHTISDLIALKVGYQQIIQHVLGDTDDDYDMVFLTK